jgi:hypothetical protein
MLEIEGLSDDRSTSQMCHEKRDGTLLSTALPLLGGLHPVRAGPLTKADTCSVMLMYVFHIARIAKRYRRS